MREIIFEFVNQYAVWGILVATIIATLLLWRGNKQIKRLNRSLSGITENIQDYLNVVMEEEAEEIFEPERVTRIRREDRFLTEEEREILLSRKKEQNVEENEAVFQAVMQEYFS